MPKRISTAGNASGRDELSLTQLQNCDDRLTPSSVPSIIHYTQLFPIQKRTQWGNFFFSCQPLHRFFAIPPNQKGKIARDIADWVQSQVPVLAGIKTGTIPDPNINKREQDKLRILSETLKTGVAGAFSDLPHTRPSPGQIQREYKELMRAVTLQQVEQIRGNLSGIIQTASDDFADRQKLAAAIATSPIFDSHFTKSTRYGVGILASYDQEWLHLGYARGELIKTLELAPGETVTLEYHYWDKSIAKSEDELSTELELKSSSTLTQRDTKQLLDELTSTNQLHLNGKEGGSIKIPDTPIELEAGVDGGISTQVQPHVSNSVNTTVEKVVNASNSFRQNRKVRIEETRDTGHENKQTRVVANTNRCHTLQFNYFEIVSHYQVTTRFAGFRPCVLLPYQLKCGAKFILKESINFKFILCNEDILKSELLDKVFLPGFDAARKVAAFEELKLLLKENVSSGSAASIGGGGETGGSLEPDFKRYRDKILQDYATISRSVRPFVEFAATVDLTDPVGAVDKTIKFVVKMANHPTTCKHALYYLSLSIKSDAFNALESLRATRDSEPAERAMTDFFAKVDENDFQFLDPLSGQIAKAFVAFGVPDAAADLLAGVVEFFVTMQVGVLIGAAVGAIAAAAGSAETGPGAAIGAAIGLGVGAIVGGGSAALLVALKNDAGLHTDVQAAQSFFKNTKLTPTGAVNEASTSAAAGTVSAAPSVFDLVSISDIAEAKAELAKLICHLRCHFEHYKQALWLSQDPEARTQFLIDSGFSDLVTNEVLGFYNGYVAFPLANLDYFNRIMSAKALREKLENIKAEDRTARIVIPTSSTTVNGQLGECDLCEDYIDLSRDADVRQQNAKAALDEAEAAYKRARTKLAEQEALRLEARLSADPPDLSDPVNHSNGKLDINVTQAGDV